MVILRIQVNGRNHTTVSIGLLTSSGFQPHKKNYYGSTPDVEYIHQALVARIFQTTLIQQM